MPHLVTRLSMLLSIATLVVVDLIKEEEVALTAGPEGHNEKHSKEHVPGKRRRDLVACLQKLGDFKTLLTPPESVISAANQAAAKAMMFIASINAGNAYSDCVGIKDTSIKCCK